MSSEKNYLNDSYKSFFEDSLSSKVPELYKAIKDELIRQQKHIKLIASENIVSQAVLEAQGSVLTNKYAEGYPGKRYYNGCEHVDVAENLAIERLKKLFNCKFANAQPHSGAQANGAVFLALLNPGDTFMGMSLNSGGHITHGLKISMSGKWFNAIGYDVDKESELIDYDNVEKLALEHKPKLIIAGGSAYSRVIDFKRFRAIADKVGALLLADISHPSGLIAKGILNDPIPHCHVVTTTTHKTLRGPRGGLILMGNDFDNPFGITLKDGSLRKMSSLLDLAVFPGNQGGPLEHIIAAKAIAFGEALTDNFLNYMLQVKKNAAAMAAAFVAKGYDIISGGTDNHMMLIDLRNKGINGKQAEFALVQADITANKNMVPFDDKSPFVTSGIRFGTAAITTRGLNESDMKTVVDLIDRVLSNIDNETAIAEVKDEVNALMGHRALFNA